MRLRFQCRKSTDHTKIYVSTAARVETAQSFLLVACRLTGGVSLLSLASAMSGPHQPKRQHFPRQARGIASLSQRPFGALAVALAICGSRKLRLN
jgi:hypothetical protein